MIDLNPCPRLSGIFIFLIASDIANSSAEALASVQSNGEQGGGSLLSMAQEAARDQMALKEKAASRRTNQIKTQRKYGF